MDNTQELVETLKAGHRLKLTVAKGESIQNAHDLFNRLERDHGLTIGRVPVISGSEVYFILWAEGYGTSPLTIGVLAGKDGQ